MAGPVIDTNLGPPAPPPAGSNDLLGTLGGLAGIQNQLNQNRLFQQSFAAKQAAGKIIASSPDMGTAAQLMQQNPTVAGFYPEIISNALANNKLNIETQGTLHDQSQSVLQGVYKALGAASSAPDQFDNALKLGLAGAPATALAQLKQQGDPIGLLQKVLGPLAKSDPQRFKQVVAGLQLGAGIDPAKVFGASGAVPPTALQSPGGGVQIIGGLGGATPPGGGPTPTGGGPTPTPSTPTPTPSTLASDGSPLYAPDSAIPKAKLGINGLPIRSAEQQKSVEQQLERFNSDQPKYDAAANSSAQIDSVLADIKTTAKGGGFLQPGAGGTWRVGLAKAINFAHNVVDPSSPAPFDSEKIAAGESALKGTTQLGFQLSNQMFGGQHQALGLVNDALHAVPGMDNTPLGAMLVGDLLKAGSQWVQEQRQFKQDWSARSAGDLTGSDTAYVTLHSPSKLVQGVLDKYGLGAEGFKKPEDVRQQFQDGLLTRGQAHEILKKQFGMGD